MREREREQVGVRDEGTRTKDCKRMNTCLHIQDNNMRKNQHHGANQPLHRHQESSRYRSCILSGQPTTTKSKHRRRTFLMPLARERTRPGDDGRDVLICIFQVEVIVRRDTNHEILAISDCGRHRDLSTLRSASAASQHRSDKVSLGCRARAMRSDR